MLAPRLNVFVWFYLFFVCKSSYDSRVCVRKFINFNKFLVFCDCILYCFAGSDGHN